MATLKALAQAIATVIPNHSILIYGPAKTGKSRLAGTAAKLKEIRRIHYFDGENGSETLAHMGLTDAEMEKVIVYKMPDTKQNPIFIETMLKAFSAKDPIAICDNHGKVDCAICKKETPPAPVSMFCLRDCTHDDLVIIDSGSQLGDSAMSAAMAGSPPFTKPGWDEYALQGMYLSDLFSVIQQCQNTNFVMITHEVAIPNVTKTSESIFPLVGSKNFCQKVAKYFGTVIYTKIKLGKHTAGSSSTYQTNVQTGSRLDVAIEKNTETPSMYDILVAGGILKPVS